MPFNINEFHSNISKSGGFAHSSLFDVIVLGPSALNSSPLVDVRGIERDMAMRINAITLPERSVNTVSYSYYGPSMTMVMDANYVPITMSIIPSPDMRERNYFLSWQDLIVGRHRSEQGIVNTRRRFDIGFYDSYAKETKVIIRRFDTDSEKAVFSLDLIECFPMMVGPIQNDWNDPEVATFSVTLAFYYFVDNFSQSSDQADEYRSTFLSRINRSGLGGALGTVLGAAQNSAAPAAAILGASSILSNFNL